MAKDKAKFAFGSLATLQTAIDAGTVDPFDLLCLVDNGVARIGWLDKDNKPVILETPEDEVVVVDELPTIGKPGVLYLLGTAVYIWHNAQFVAISESTDLATFEARLGVVERDVEQLKADVSAMDTYVRKRYEVSYAPEGTLVDYRDKEIRVMCPANTAWTKQTVGGTGNPNMHYMGFKAYAPEGAVSFREDDKEFIEDQKMYYFDNNDFAGVDEFGRKYSICWLALASCDPATGAWTYFGKNSSFDKYIGWYYSVEWYDAHGKVIASDRIRINLSNEECHLEIKPFYMSQVIQDVKNYTDQTIEAKIAEIIEIPVVEF